MGDFYRNFTVIKSFLKKSDREVILAKPIDYYKGYPEYFVVKIFDSPSEPRELIIHRQLAASYPSVIQIYDSWSDGVRFYMSIEYCEGGDLHKYFEASSGNLFPFPTILIYCYQLAETVGSMHYLKICHRDIKPLNIYIKNNFENFKLGDFGEAKPVLEDEGYHTITGTPFYMSPEQKKSLDDKVGLIVNPYRDDIWALGRTFMEIGLCRLCPEMYRMEIKEMHRFIEDEFRELGYDEDFITLIKKMMQSLENFQITSMQVMDELQRIYFKLLEKNDKKLEKSHVECASEEITYHNNPDLVFIDEENKESIVSYPTKTQKNEASSDYNLNQLKKVSVSSENSSSSIEIFHLHEDKFDYEIKNPFSGPIDFKGPSADFKVSLEKSQIKNAPPLNLGSPGTGKSAPSESSKPNINIPPFLPSYVPEASSPIKRPPNIPSPPILNRGNSGKPINQKKEDINSSNVKIDSDDSSKISRLSYQGQKNALGLLSNPNEDSKKISIHGRNSLPLNANENIEEQKSKNCSFCNKAIMRSSCEMPCKHLYHPNCIKEIYESKIIKMSKRSDEMLCYKCETKIPFHFFERCAFLEPSAKLNISLQLFSTTKFVCPNCHVELEFTILSKKFKACDKKCTNCKSNFCRFCLVQGGHRFFCDLLKNFKKGNVCIESFIKK